MSASEQVVIVGAGHAGGAAAALLRQHGWEGAITLVGAEPDRPYQRPPLSKGWLKGEETAESLQLRSARFYAEHRIELRLSSIAERIDTAARTLCLTGGEMLAYDYLILATGSRNRPLPVPGADLDGVLALRNAADADRIQAVLKPGAKLAVVGGGFIGLEVAASARKLGAEVTVIEREGRLLPRVVCEELSAHFAKRHRDEGVTLLLGAAVAGFEGENGQVCAVTLADGERITCDAALVGIGAMAEDELARAAGLECDNGVIVDPNARSSDPRIFAIGDCTRRPLPHYDTLFRLESVPNALDQANLAARAICGRPAPAPEVPWFWSDQYDIRLQIAGLPIGTRRTVLRGSIDKGKFAMFHLNGDGRVICVEAVNLPQAMAVGKIMIARQKVVSADQLADEAIPLKELVK